MGCMEQELTTLTLTQGLAGRRSNNINPHPGASRRENYNINPHPGASREKNN